MKKNKKNCKSSNITHLLEHEPIDFGLVGVTIGENKSRSHAAPANKQKRTQTKRNLPGRYYHIWSRKEKKKFSIIRTEKFFEVNSKIKTE